ncbi:MAG: S-methyl-5-thioribose-1-phosphate isomerase [Bacillota bacterium]|nr:S-methyl-5-thioribose-1-phosphate isomerase [Bacillota bacterium]
MDKLIKKYVEELKKEKLLLPAWYEDGKIIMLDQVKLPEEVYVELKTSEEIGKAIKDMIIRGSGAIALAGIYGILMETFNTKGNAENIKKAGEYLKATRPTAVNMHQTVDSLTRGIDELDSESLIQEIQTRSIDIMKKQLEVEKQIGKNGADLIKDGETILTICHAGGVAGFGFGGRTLSVFRTAVAQGKNIKVIACETRPYLQGARITAWELKKLGIPVTLITDNMVGAIAQKGMFDRVITGSDRLAVNGDTANKIGTYMISLVAKAHNIPFHISTSKYNIDLNSENGKNIEIEMRDSEEVVYINGERITVEGVEALYPGFDITPNENITAIITEAGALTRPFKDKLIKLAKEA